MSALSSIPPKEAGDLLLEAGKLTEAQLEQVRRRQRRLNVPQHRAIVDLNFASEQNAQGSPPQAGPRRTAEARPTPTGGASGPQVPCGGAPGDGVGSSQLCGIRLAGGGSIEQLSIRAPPD